MSVHRREKNEQTAKEKASTGQKPKTKTNPKFVKSQTWMAKKIKMETERERNRKHARSGDDPEPTKETLKGR